VKLRFSHRIVSASPNMSPGLSSTGPLLSKLGGDSAAPNPALNYPGFPFWYLGNSSLLNCTAHEPNGFSAVSDSAAAWPGASALLLTPSGLDGEQRAALAAFCERSGCGYSKDWSAAVTHCVSGPPPAAGGTLKLMAARCSQAWVVPPAWVEACLAAQALAPAARFQLGPPRGAGQGLLAGLRVHLTGEFGGPGGGLSAKDLGWLVELAGGRVVALAPLPPSPGEAPDEALRVLARPIAGGGRNRAAEAAACAMRVPVISCAWLTESLAAARLADWCDHVLAPAP
jgi:hypothetical protein